MLRASLLLGTLVSAASDSVEVGEDEVVRVTVVEEPVVVVDSAELEAVEDSELVVVDSAELDSVEVDSVVVDSTEEDALVEVEEGEAVELLVDTVELGAAVPSTGNI